MSDTKLLFQLAKVSSCNCCTMSPEAQRHDEHCRYRLICEVEAQSQLDLEQANKDIQVLAGALSDALTEILRPTISRERYKEILEVANGFLK